MARLLTCGWESGYTNSAAAAGGADELAPLTGSTYLSISAEWSVVANPSWWKSSGNYCAFVYGGYGLMFDFYNYSIPTWVGFKFGTTALPSATAAVFEGDSNSYIQMELNANGSLTLTTNTGSATTAAGLIAANTCYAIDIKGIVGDYELWVNGIEVASTTTGTTAFTGQIIFESDNTAANANWYFDDFYANNATASNSGQTGRRGSASVLALRPLLDVGSSPTGFTNSAGLTFGNTTTGWFSAIDPMPYAGAVTSYLGKSTANTNVYTGSCQASPASAIPQAVAVVWWQTSSSTSSGNANMTVTANATTTAAVTSTIAAITPFSNRIDMDTCDGTNAWTQAILNGVNFNWGSSTVVTGNPRLLDVILSYEIADPTPPPFPPSVQAHFIGI